MFENLTDRLGKVLRSITGTSKITEENIQVTLQEVRKALLEADVAFEVVQNFIVNVKDKLLGQAIDAKLSPSQYFVKIVHDELIQLMGEKNESLQFKTQSPVVILMAGLQGAGKTTTVAKLARLLRETQKKKVMVVSCDVYRPAAIDQLKTVAKEVGAEFFSSNIQEKPEYIAKAALDEAKRSHKDVLIVDTAGRLHIAEDMMQEIKVLHNALKPAETLFVVDSMTGQDAAKSAQAFNAALPLTGVILTKVDGDARGGAALSVRYLTGKPIKFLGVGEKLDALEPFYPERVASRILGMGDVLSLVEEIERKVDKQKAEKLARKIAKKQGFDLEDFCDQLKQMTNMGGLAGMIDKLPGMGAIPKEALNKVNDKQLVYSIALINSMTPKERRFPQLIQGSRKRRIACGAGLQIQDVNRLLKQFQQMQKMLKKISGKGKMMQMLRGLQGKLPPGSLPPGLM
jgi:signal recognition particle subunit SRP54